MKREWNLLRKIKTLTFLSLLVIASAEKVLGGTTLRSTAFIGASSPLRNQKSKIVNLFPSTHNNDEDFNIEQFTKTCKRAFATTILSIGMFCLPTDASIPTSQPFSHDRLIPNLERISLIPPAYAAVDNDLVPTSFHEKHKSTVLDEVWTLIDKYYLDKSFNGQDWKSVRNFYESKIAFDNDGNYNDDDVMKLTTAMVKSLGDKYSRILDREAYSRIQKFDLIGVGATLMPDNEKRIMVGAPPVAGSEAEKAGIKYGDYIIAVNGIETKGRTAFEIIDQITEDPEADQSTITMTVLSQGENDLPGEGYVRDVTMKRQFVEVKNPIEYRLTEKRRDGTNVGYVRIAEFNSLVKPKLEEAINNLKKEGANAYVIDLRGNPGGAFQSAVEIAGLFVNDKIATTVVDGNQVEMPFKTSKDKAIIEDQIPMVLWLDGGSASASEVLAGALHDTCRSVTMGQKSYGKGLIQAVYGLQNGTGLVLTVAKYVTPNGSEIQGVGVQPDIETKLPFLLIPGLSSDTSKVDFNAVSNRLAMCLAEAQ